MAVKPAEKKGYYGWHLLMYDPVYDWLMASKTFEIVHPTRDPNYLRSDFLLAARWQKMLRD